LHRVQAACRKDNRTPLQLIHWKAHNLRKATGERVHLLLPRARSLMACQLILDGRNDSHIDIRRLCLYALGICTDEDKARISGVQLRAMRSSLSRTSRRAPQL
jgi:hypothetical protein